MLSYFLEYFALSSSVSVCLLVLCMASEISFACSEAVNGIEKARLLPKRPPNLKERRQKFIIITLKINLFLYVSCSHPVGQLNENPVHEYELLVFNIDEIELLVFIGVENEQLVFNGIENAHLLYPLNSPFRINIWGGGRNVHYRFYRKRGFLVLDSRLTAQLLQKGREIDRPAVINFQIIIYCLFFSPSSHPKWSSVFNYEVRKLVCLHSK